MLSYFRQGNYVMLDPFGPNRRVVYKAANEHDAYYIMRLANQLERSNWNNRVLRRMVWGVSFSLALVLTWVLA